MITKNYTKSLYINILDAVVGREVLIHDIRTGINASVLSTEHDWIHVEQSHSAKPFQIFNYYLQSML